MLLLGFKAQRAVEDSDQDEVDDVVDSLRSRIEELVGTGEKMTRRLREVGLVFQAIG